MTRYFSFLDTNIVHFICFLYSCSFGWAHLFTLVSLFLTWLSLPVFCLSCPLHQEAVGLIQPHQAAPPGLSWRAGQGTHTIWLTEAPQPPQGRWESSLLIRAQRGNQRERKQDRKREEKKHTDTNYMTIHWIHWIFKHIMIYFIIFRIFVQFTKCIYLLNITGRKITLIQTCADGLVCTHSGSKLFPHRAITSKVRDPSPSGSHSTGSGPSHWIQLFRDEPPCQKITTLTFWICFCGA